MLRYFMALLPEVVTTLRLIIGIWIIVAGALKFQNYFGFIRTMKQSKLFGDRQATIVGYSYPFIEVLTGLAITLNTTLFIPALVIVFVKQILTSIGITLMIRREAKIENLGSYGTLIPTPLHWIRLVDHFIIAALCLILLVNVGW